jgi:hypothetical protein
MTEIEPENNGNVILKQAVQPKEHHITIPMGKKKVEKRKTEELDGNMASEKDKFDESRNGNTLPEMTKLPSQVSAESTKLLPQMTSED